MKKSSKQYFIPILGILLFCFYPGAFLYFQNAGEASFLHILPVFLIFLTFAAVIQLISWPITGSFAKAGIFTLLAMAYAMNFDPICNAITGLVPVFRIRYQIAAFAILFVLILLGLRKVKFDCVPICLIVSITVGVILAVNVVTAVPKIYAKLTFRPEVKPETEAVVFQGDTPNVYYIICDEYGGPQNLERYYDFDNADFYGVLQEKGFSISRNSFNKESLHTDTIIPNLVNLGYVTSDKDETANRLKYLKEPLLYRIFENNGYQVNMVNHSAMLDETGCKVLDMSLKRDTVSDLALQKSILLHFDFVITAMNFLKNPAFSLGRQTNVLEADNLRKCLEATQNSWKSAKNQKTFTICYLQCPHVGFYFDKDGNLISNEDIINWVNPDIYMGQLQYTNQYLLKTVEEIQKNDKDAVIILQSDHGARYASHVMVQSDTANYNLSEERIYMQNTLNCVYYKGQPLDIDGLSGINTLRYVLDTVFGTQLGQLTQTP